MAEKCGYTYCTPYYARCEAVTITHPRTAELAGHPSTPTFAASVGTGLKELITFRESRAQMIAPLPMVLAGLAGFPRPRAARLRRGASFGLLWRRLCDLQLGVYGSLRLCDRLPGVCALPRLCGLRLCACGSSRLCDRLLGVCALPRLCGLRLCACGSLRLAFLRSSAWGSSLPPLRLGKGLNLKLLVYARPALGDKKCKDRTLRGAGGFHINSGCRRGCGLPVWVGVLRSGADGRSLVVRFCVDGSWVLGILYI
jgi:hypothetical protein